MPGRPRDWERERERRSTTLLPPQATAYLTHRARSPSPFPSFCSLDSNCMNENEIATSIRKALSVEWPDCTWQVLVGRNFGSFVSFEESRYIYFYIAQVREWPWAASSGPLPARLPPRRLLHTPRPLHSPPPPCHAPPLCAQVGFVVFSSD